MAKNKTYLSCIEIEPTGPAERCIIWLHGLGADGNDFVPIVPELHLPHDLGIRFIFPHAPIMPVTINNGYEMRAWYDIASLDIDANRTIDMKTIVQSKESVELLIEREMTRGIVSENIILAGFSQGAVIALITGLSLPLPLAGLIALSGYLPSAKQTLQKASKANLKKPIFMAHGTLDTIVPFMAGKAASIELAQAQYDVTWHAYPIPHSVSPEEIRDLANWIKTIWVK